MPPSLKVIPLGGLGEIGKNCMGIDEDHVLVGLDDHAVFADFAKPAERYDFEGRGHTLNHPYLFSRRRCGRDNQGIGVAFALKLPNFLQG